MKKLTLSVDEEVIRLAKLLADREKTTVSVMFAKFIRALAKSESRTAGVPSDSIAFRAARFMSLPKGKTARDVLTEALLDKHGGRQ